MLNIPADEITNRDEYLKILRAIDKNLTYLERIDYQYIWDVFKTLYKIAPTIELTVDWVSTKDEYSKEEDQYSFFVNRNFRELYTCPVLPVLFNPVCYMDYVGFILSYCLDIINEEIKRVTNSNHSVWACRIDDRWLLKGYELITETPKGKQLIYDYSLEKTKELDKMLSIWADWRRKDEK